MFELAHQQLYLRLSTLAFCNIPDDRQHQPPLLDLDRAQHNVDREFRAIGASRPKVQAHTRRTCLRVLQIAGAVRYVAVTKALRDEYLDRLAKHALARQAK